MNLEDLHRVVKCESVYVWTVTWQGWKFWHTRGYILKPHGQIVEWMLYCGYTCYFSVDTIAASTGVIGITEHWRHRSQWPSLWMVNLWICVDNVLHRQRLRESASSGFPDQAGRSCPVYLRLLHCSFVSAKVAQRQRCSCTWMSGWTSNCQANLDIPPLGLKYVSRHYSYMDTERVYIVEVPHLTRVEFAKLCTWLCTCGCFRTLGHDGYLQGPANIICPLRVHHRYLEWPVQDMIRNRISWCKLFISCILHLL